MKNKRELWVDPFDIPSPGSYKVAHALLEGDPNNEFIHFRKVDPEYDALVEDLICAAYSAMSSGWNEDDEANDVVREVLSKLEAYKKGESDEA